MCLGPVQSSNIPLTTTLRLLPTEGKNVDKGKRRKRHDNRREKKKIKQKGETRSKSRGNEGKKKRGRQTLTFGPLKPKGLRDKDGNTPYAVLQLRQDNAIATLYNLVGFQTNMK